MTTALISFERAEQACLVFIGQVLGLQVGDGKDICRDDYIEPDLVNKGVFNISGGPEQVQNYGGKPGPGWFAFGNFMMQFETRADAIATLGKLQNGFPPRLASGCPGLAPNVSNFEITQHPEIRSTLVADMDGSIIGRIHVLIVQFRVVYNNTTD